MTTSKIERRTEAASERKDELNGFAAGGERLLNAVLDAMQDDHIYVTDREGRFVYISAPGARAMGWDRAEKLGKTPLEAGVSPEAVARGDAERKRVFAGEAVSGVMQYTLSDGLHDYEYTASTLPGANGKPEYALTRLRDVTERNRSREREEAALAALMAEQTETETAAREADAKFHTLAEAIPGFVWTAPQGKTLDWVNQRYWEYTGHAETLPITDASPQAIHPDDLPRSLTAWFTAQAAGQPYEYELRIRGADGVYRWFLARSVPYRDSAGTVVRWFGVTTDIDERKRAQIELETLNTRLKRVMAETHHRVKNNLQVIAGLLELEATSREGPIPAEELLRFTQHVRSLAAVHDLLTEDAKRGGSGDFVEARAILEQLLPMLEVIAGDKKIVAHLADARITGPQGASFSLIANELIHNAIKHSATGIYVNFAADDKNATLTVADDGPGFPPDFDPALSAHTGLELVQHLTAWDLRGRVSFDNRREGGARTTVIMPLPAASPEEWK